MRIAVFVMSCCVAVGLSGCLKPRRGPPEFLLAPGEMRSSSGGSNDYAGAAATLAAAAGATVAQREVYDICYASCPNGTACNPETGLCERLPCGGKCPADRRCKIVEGKETCVLGEPDRGVVPLGPEPGAGQPGAGQPGAAEPGAREPAPGRAGEPAPGRAGEPAPGRAGEPAPGGAAGAAPRPGPRVD
ncbi:hypothetical protein [Sorangium sp. So ce1097]|uniref:hypothetical protein n=1 Tax=Sorangium sp. So ce1097 TaxID=3133330 RepID=UPI003F5D9BFA